MFKQAVIKPQRFGNLVAVEFRKLFSTIPNRILIAAVLVSPVLLAAVVQLEFAAIFGGPASWLVMNYFVQVPTQYLLPPLIILLVAGEWGTRSAMTTFTLTPRRSHVVAAKGIVTLVISSLAWAWCAGVSIGGTALGFRANGYAFTEMWMPAADVAKTYLAYLLIMATAFALALLIHNTAAAIGVVLVVPIVLQVAIQLGTTIGRVAEWINLNTQVQNVLLAGDNSSWPKLVVSGIVWIVAPLVIGSWWTIRREAA